MNLVLTCIIAMAAIAVSVSTAIGAEIPKSGTFKVFGGWKAVGETTNVGEHRIVASGHFWGVTYSDSGAGPLHAGPAICPYTLEMIEGNGTAQGLCAWGDTDGDKIFTNWSGSLAAAGEFRGMNQISGGTGKFKGIQGKAPFNCRALNGNGQWSCTLQFEYRLP